MSEELDEGVWESMQRLLQGLVPERTFRFIVKHPPNSICIRRDGTSFIVKAINKKRVSVILLHCCVSVVCNNFNSFRQKNLGRTSTYNVY